MDLLARVAVVAAAVASGLWILEQSGNLEGPGWLAAAAVMVLAGGIADRFWAALLPVLAYLPFLLFLVATQPGGEAGFSSWQFGAAVYGVLAVGATVGMVAGLGLRRAWRHDREERLSAGASRPRTTPRDSR
jgi:hypothetical protein